LVELLGRRLIIDIVISAVVAAIFFLLGLKVSQMSHEDLKSEFKQLRNAFDNVAEKYVEQCPEVSKEIRKVLKFKANVAQPSLLRGSPCPNCKKKKTEFQRWGVGPLGSFNAWYKCSNCGFEYQTQEIPE